MAEPPKRNPAMRMLGLPALPKKLPSRNWLIFWTLSTTLSAAIIYDRREKRRATARWAHAVSHLANEPLANASAMPRKLTIFLSAPPGDGLRAAQDHYTEYVKPVLATTGIDWEFVVGRREGDVRAVVAEKIRRTRRESEGLPQPEQTQAQTEADAVENMRRRNSIQPYEGVRGDIVIGRNTWKEYVRGVHEGWLGPLTAPPESITPGADPKEGEEGETEEEKPKSPSQPQPYIMPEQYSSGHLPMLIPAELGPSTEIRFPHILGFLSTPTRMRRYFGKRYLADEIGREVAAVCFATYREYNTDLHDFEQQHALEGAEKDWVKSVWKEEEAEKPEEGEKPVVQVPRERIWASPMVLDSRIATRMRRFELQPDDEARARQIVVREEEIEGWIKGHLRQLGRWAAGKWRGEQFKVNVGNIDDEE